MISFKSQLDLLDNIIKSQSAFNLSQFFSHAENCVLFVLLAPFLKSLPCPEQTSAQKAEFVKRINYYLTRLNLGYIIEIVQREVLSSRTLRVARVQSLIKEAKIHDETKLYKDQRIPFIPIKP